MAVVKEKEFVCRRCGKTFTWRARKMYFCPDCARKEKSEYVMRNRAKKDPSVKIGVGSGGNQWGKKNHQFRGGGWNYKGIYATHHEDEVPHCEICFSTDNLCIHHIDKNHSNNDPENLIMLCRRCHAKVHGLEKNFEINEKRTAAEGGGKDGQHDFI